MVLTTCGLVQLGLGDTLQRSSPVVGVFREGSGVTMVACGHVRLFAKAVWRLLVLL